MKRILLITGIIITCGVTVFSQMTTPVRIKAGEDLYQKLAREIYLYPSFKKGMVLFKDGHKNQADLNFNFLNGEMQFIDEKGDTLSLAEERTISDITIGKDSFFYDDGYLQLIAGNETVKLVRRQRIRIIDQQKVGAYDQPSSAGAITSYNTLPNQIRNFKLDVRQDVIMGKQTTYYIGDRYNRFFRVTKKNLLKNFPKKETELNNYLKGNNVDFENEVHLSKILEILKS
jgi:hypothetical protein